MRAWCLLLLGTLLLPPVGLSQESQFTLVVSPENDVSSLSRKDVARMFLKRTRSWPDGSAVIPVDQSSRATVRVVFTKDVLEAEGLEKMSAVESFWQKQIFSGRGSPPPIKGSDDEVVAFVAKTPGAIGYVSEGTELGTVKIVQVAD